MGVLNVTPDSFSDGGKFFDPKAAEAHGREMAAAGAALIDVGGESTRPGSQPVPAGEQIRRIVPVISALKDNFPALISVDTTQSAVAQAALDAGANLINDISAGRDDPQMLPLAAQYRTPIVLMHMQGTPATMQVNPTYENVTREVIEFLAERIRIATALGIDPSSILIDPGIGFGKRMEHNFALIRQLRDFRALPHPMVVGMSRKGFIRKVSGEDLASGRPFGTAAAVAWAAANGADILRVHDVGPMSQVVRIIEAIQGVRAADFPSFQ
jgi:dihydropteroate synthase